MNSLLRSALGRFRAVSLLEGLSYLVLLGYAMPLKYVWGDPTWVRWTGRVHGALFVVFVLALMQATRARGWTPGKATRAFGLSLVPFGAFVLERELAEEARLSDAGTGRTPPLPTSCGPR